MPKNAAPVRVTGGPGFNFEDNVAAFFLASMLARSHPCGPEIGTPSLLEWQVPDTEPGLDDLLVTSSAAIPIRLAISIKSNRQVTQSGFPRAFVKAASACCDGTSTDFPCLAVGQLAGAVRESWHALLKEARFGNPNSVAVRYTSKGYSNKIGRDLFRSFAVEQKEPDTETVRLIKKVRLLYFDFTENESRDEARSIEMCQGALLSGQGDEAIRLWNRLIGIAAERRASGGALDYPGLIEALGTEYALKDRIDHSRDWVTLDRRSADVMKSVRDTVGDRVCLVRRELINELRSHTWEGGPVLIVGDGGSGKSSIAKRLAQYADLFDRCLWLNAAALDFDSVAEVERFLGIENTLISLLTAGSGPRACLVLDGLEVFSQRSLARASSILELLGPDPSLRGWTVFATTRPQAVVSAHQLIARASIVSEQCSTVYVKPPSDDECSQVLETCRGFNGVLIRRELRTALANLKILDWLASDSDGFEESEVQSWAGITGVINALWGRWVGNDSASASRSGVMKRLGRLEGEGLLRGVGTSELDTAEHGALNELESLDLLTVSDERVLFRHDILGDWARLRILIEKSPRGKALAEYARFPRWHDAIRLYGQRLLEADNAAPARWTDALASIDGDGTNAMLVRDMFVEGLFCTPAASELLEKAWPALTENEGLLLQRMLGRFQHVATIPDPRVTAMSSTAEEKAELAMLVRFPWWPLWPGVLSTLAVHADEVARLCPIDAAQVCALWLRCIPIGAIGRTEAGTIALAIGREIQVARVEERRYYHDNSDTVVFEAVLLASPEHPDQVAALCLELARRRPDPPDVVVRAKAYKERFEKKIDDQFATNPPSKEDYSDTSMLFDKGTLRSQFPDGPANKVDDALQRAVLETQGLITLASIRPDEAKELLLACSLEPPRYVCRDNLMKMLDRLGIENIRGMYQPMYFRGPWLQLIRQNPSLGVDCIMRLVDHATEQWELNELPPSPTDEQRAAARMSLTTDGTQRVWHGNMRTYGWHRERFCNANLLSSALMALERFLYECLDQDQPIDAVVTQILTTGRSVATLAILVSVAKYKPELLAGCLKPLLAGWHLYGWDIQLVIDGDSWKIGFFQWTRSGERLFNSARDWHTMPHRKSHFRDHALGLLLTHPETREEYKAIRAGWQAELESGSCPDPVSLELLIPRFDPDNYKAVPLEDGAYEVHFEWPDEIKARTEENVHKAQDGMRLIAFPFRCRELLEKGEPINDDQARNIWEETQAFSASPEDDDELSLERRLDAVLGGVAVLQMLAPEWLLAHGDHAEWCRAQISRVISSAPTRTIYDSEHSISTDKWHSFLAYIAITWLVEDRNATDARELASLCVMSNWYATTGVTLTAAHRHRAELGDEFNRLVNLAVLWAALRTTLHYYDPSENEIKRFKMRAVRLQSAFIAGRIPSDMLDWDAVADVARRARDRAHCLRFPEYDGATTLRRRANRGTPTLSTRRNKIARLHPGFDIEALRHAFVWLKDPSTTDTIQTTQTVAWLDRLLGVTLSMIPESHDDDHNEVEGTPYEYDTWVFDHVANCVARIESDEIARRLWEPILNLGPQADYWVESFLGDWTVSALAMATSSERYFDRWRQMIRYAIESPVWMPEGGSRFRLIGLWEHLLGMHLGASIVAADGNQAEFAKMKDEYGVWADAYLYNSRSLRAFLNLLRQPGARPLLRPAVPWLRRIAEALRPYDWERDPLADDLAAVMNLAWTWHSETIATDQALITEFMALLNLLIIRQSRTAMTLRDTVARSAVTPSE